MAAFEAMWRPLLREQDEIFWAQPVTWAGDRPMPGSRAATETELRERPPCRHLYHTMQIYWDGRTSPCTYDHACKLHIGDASQQSVEEIWSGEPLAKLRTLHEQGRSGEQTNAKAIAARCSRRVGWRLLGMIPADQPTRKDTAQRRKPPMPR